MFCIFDLRFLKVVKQFILVSLSLLEHGFVQEIPLVSRLGSDLVSLRIIRLEVYQVSQASSNSLTILTLERNILRAQKLKLILN